MTETINMTEILKTCEEYENDLVEINKAIKRVASTKCRLKKMPGRKSYNEEMTKVLQEEQLLKSAKDYLAGPRKNVNTVTQEEVDAMDYDEVCKAIRSIQSKKTHTKWAEDCEKDKEGNYIPGSGESYREACRVEAMLMERRKVLKPVDDMAIRKTDLMAMLETLKLASDLTVEACIERIEKFIEEN